MKKRLLAVFITLVLSCNLLLPALAVEEPDNPKDKKIICTATLDDNFTDDTVIVVVNNTNSLNDKNINLKSFGTDTFDELEEFKIDVDELDNYEYINSEEYKRIIYLKLKNPGKENVLSAIKKLEKLDWVESAESNYINSIDNGTSSGYEVNIDSEAYQALAANSKTPNDPRYSEQYGLSKINVSNAWDYTTGSHEIKVAVIDTGIYPHSDLNANLVKGWNFADNNDNTTDLNGHGTHVAGIIGAVGNNSVGITGVCWNITLVPLRISEGNTGNAYTDVICKAIQYAANNNIPIINQSFDGDPSNAVEAAIRNYKGLFICCAGNDTKNIDVDPTYPASNTYDNILTVASLNTSNTGLSDFSNYGAESVDMAAPGENILSTYLNNGYYVDSGTSMAAPFVAGTAALIKSYRPDLSAADIKYIIMTEGNSCSALKGKVKSDTPILNAGNALLGADAVFASPLTGDINGDGRADMVGIGSHGGGRHGYIYVHTATSSNTFVNSYTSPRKVVNYNDDIWLQDVNGDGKDDIVRRVGAGYSDTGYIYVALSNGTGFTFWSHSSGKSVVSRHDKIQFGDVNGDGKTDIICTGAINQWDEGHIYTALSNGSGFTFWSTTTGRKVVSTGDRLSIGDVNGDGKDDLICEGNPNSYDAGYIYTALSNGTGFTFWTANSGKRVLKNADDRLWVGDVNGDGKDDLIVQAGINTVDQGHIFVALSYGSFFTFWSCKTGERVVSLVDEIYVADVNGDGKCDLIAQGGIGKWDEGYIWTALSNGLGFTFWTANTGKKVIGPRDKVFINDFNKDNKADIMVVEGYGSLDAGRLNLALSNGSSFNFWTWRGGYIGP